MAEVIEITIDASDLMTKINRLRQNMTEVRFQRAMYTIFRRTGLHAKAILKKDLPQKYQVKAGAVGSTVKKPTITIGGAGVGCIIPIQGPRLKIGSDYKATGSARGWESLHKRYRVRAKIVKGRTSTLPARWHTGFPPFRNMPSKLNNIAYARTSRSPGPIDKLTGIAIPQMPMNLAEPLVQQDLKDYLEKQIDERMRWLVMSGL